MDKKKLRMLFIGNSHTFVNDMPEMVAEKFREDGYDCEVTMIAHGRWYLKMHAEEPDVRFNILYGHYDYVVLQEFAHPFDKEEEYFAAVRKINEWIKEAGSKTVIYMTWARLQHPELQPRMNAAGRKIAAELGALLAPVGEYWWDYMKAHPELYMYKRDGSHASSSGHKLAASVLYQTMKDDLVIERTKTMTMTNNELWNEGYASGYHDAVQGNVYAPKSDDPDYVKGYDEGFGSDNLISETPERREHAGSKKVVTKIEKHESVSVEYDENEPFT